MSDDLTTKQRKSDLKTTLSDLVASYRECMFRISKPVRLLSNLIKDVGDFADCCEEFSRNIDDVEYYLMRIQSACENLAHTCMDITKADSEIEYDLNSVVNSIMDKVDFWWQKDIMDEYRYDLSMSTADRVQNMLASVGDLASVWPYCAPQPRPDGYNLVEKKMDALEFVIYQAASALVAARRGLLGVEPWCLSEPDGLGISRMHVVVSIT